MKIKSQNEKTNICCICGKEYVGYGNNPYPIDWDVYGESDRCCDECNVNYVIPARIAKLAEREK